VSDQRAGDELRHRLRVAAGGVEDRDAAFAERVEVEVDGAAADRADHPERTGGPDRRPRHRRGVDEQDLRVADQRDQLVDRLGVLAQRGIGLVVVEPRGDAVDVLPERTDPAGWRIVGERQRRRAGVGEVDLLEVEREPVGFAVGGEPGAEQRRRDEAVADREHPQPLGWSSAHPRPAPSANCSAHQFLVGRSLS
jgi:hypothetical protein